MMTRSEFLFGRFWTGWHRWAAWSICVGVIVLLGVLRTATDADYTFASLAMLPVLAIAWVDGKRNGLLVALLAVAMWLVSDIASGRQFSDEWIPWVNAITRLFTYSVAVLLVTRVRLQFEQEHDNAMHDALTGLQNRRAFLAAGAFEVERAKRYAHPMAVIYLDLDDFKKLNDSKGHAAGDAALRATAAALSGSMRATDRVARMGGDEFAVLLPETGYEAAVDTGRKISTVVNAALMAFLPAQVSIGVAWFGKADRLFPAMLTAADELMYEVKESGKHDMRSRRVAAVEK
jgi:diguanylate cyclase (GGDEF)-like protein